MLRNDLKLLTPQTQTCFSGDQRSKIPRLRNNVNMFTATTLYSIVTGQRFRHQRSSLLLLALCYRPSKNRKTPPELELKAGHTVVTTSQFSRVRRPAGLAFWTRAMPTPFLPLVMAEEFHQSSTQIGLVSWQQVLCKRCKQK